MNFSKVAGLNQLNRKIAPIKSTTQAGLFFSLSTLVLQALYSSLQRQ